MNFVVLLLLLFIKFASMYEWTCSPYDSANNRYYLPYFGETSDIFQLTWQSSAAGVTYVYPINSSELNCTGLVTALEFCYTTTIPPTNPQNPNTFRFLILTRTHGNTFEVTKSVLLTTNPARSTCINMDMSTNKCCQVHAFSQEEDFHLPSPNSAFGFGPESSDTAIIQGLFADVYPAYTTNAHTSSLNLSPGVSYNLRTSSDQTLRLAWLHLAPLPRSTPIMTSKTTLTPPIMTSTTLTPPIIPTNSIIRFIIAGIVVALVTITCSATIVAVIIGRFIYHHRRSIKLQNNTAQPQHDTAMKAKPLKDNEGAIGVVATGTSAFTSITYSEIAEDFSPGDSFEMNKNSTYGLSLNTHTTHKSSTTAPIVTTANQAYGYSNQMVGGAAVPATYATVYEDCPDYSYVNN